ncbi:MAG TPA: hypothetical protein VGP43_00285 [Chitinophagaceae bacterium]|nr:hypothetical protein [Chitinophagaceae bacterium]
MKIEQVLVHQLYNKKKITLQGIGSFNLDSSVSLPVDADKGMIIPENALSFEYDPRAVEDEGLIDAIVQNTKKIKPLASSDLDSFLMLGRQFLNIGKPFTIEGLGTLDKAQSGELFFIPGQFTTPKIEAPKALKANESEEKSGLFPDYNAETKNNYTKPVLIIVTILLLALGAWAAYYFFYQKKNTEQVNKPQPVQNNTDSVALNKETTIAPAITNDNYTFKIVFKKTADKRAALRAYNRMKEYGHTVIMYTTDSVIYKVAEPFTLPLSDTAHIKDSLNKYYYLGKGRVELK